MANFAHYVTRAYGTPSTDSASTEQTGLRQDPSPKQPAIDCLEVPYFREKLQCVAQTTARQGSQVHLATTGQEMKKIFEENPNLGNATLKQKWIDEANNPSSGPASSNTSIAGGRHCVISYPKALQDLDGFRKNLGDMIVPPSQNALDKYAILITAHEASHCRPEFSRPEGISTDGQKVTFSQDELDIFKETGPDVMASLKIRSLAAKARASGDNKTAQEFEDIAKVGREMRNGQDKVVTNSIYRTVPAIDAALQVPSDSLATMGDADMVKIAVSISTDYILQLRKEDQVKMDTP